MLKRNVFKILAIVFFLLGGISYFNSSKVTPKKTIESKSVVKKFISPTLPTVVLTYIDTPIPTQVIVNLTNTPTPQPISIPPTSAPQVFKVSLTIGRSSVGSFDLLQGSNQCDVLSQALSQGKIQNLNMRYNNDLGTNAVYQINEVGKENAVWWTYKVNGMSPSQGCSYIKVNDGDNIVWEYIGN